MKTKTLTLLVAATVVASLAAGQQGPSTNIDAKLINTDPVPIQTGETGDIRFKVVNTGDTAADNVKITLQDRYPFRVLEDRQKAYDLGKMVPGQEYTISTEVRVAEDADDGERQFRTVIESGDISFTDDIAVEVEDTDVELSLANLKTTPPTLRPDTDDNKLSIDLVNTGDKQAENVVLDLGYPGEGFERRTSFATRQSLGTVNPGQTKTADFTFDLAENTEPGLKTVNASIKYSEPDAPERQSTLQDFQMTVEGKPIFEVEKTSQGLTEGSSGTVTLNVTNTGSEESESTRVRVVEASDRPLSFGSTSSYIGTLQPGKTTSVEFSVTPDSGSAGDHLVDFQVRGVKDPEVFTSEHTVELQVSEGSSGSNLPIFAGIGLLAVLAFYFRDRILSAVRNRE